VNYSGAVPLIQLFVLSLNGAKPPRWNVVLKVLAGAAALEFNPKRRR
jgi:hypothetical protein